MSRKEGKSPDEVFAESYRAYLTAVRDGLAKVDVEAIDVSRATGAASSLYTYFTYFTYYTWHTWYTWHTINTINTINTIGTESSLGE